MATPTNQTGHLASYPVACRVQQRELRPARLVGAPLHALRQADLLLPLRKATPDVRGRRVRVEVEALTADVDATAL